MKSYPDFSDFLKDHILGRHRESNETFAALEEITLDAAN